MGVCEKGGFLTDAASKLRKHKKNRSGIPRSRRKRPVQRTRVKGKYTLETQELRQPQVTGNSYSISAEVRVPPSEYSEMHDTVGFKQLSWNPCHHITYQADLRRLPLATKEALGTVAIPGDYSVDALQWLRTFCPQPPAEVIDDLSAMAEQQFLESTPTDTQLANFIIELIIVVLGIIKHLGSLAKLLERMRRNFQHELAKLLNEKTLSIADCHYLAWSFAIKPFIGDVKRLICSAEKARKRLIWLQRHNGCPTIVRNRRQNCWQLPSDQTDHFVAAVPDFYSGINPDPPLEPILVADATPMETRIRFTKYNVTFAAQGLVIFHIPKWLLEFPPACDVIWQGQQGFFNPLAILWEALPFSWLLDWFLSYRTKLWTNLGEINPIPDAELLSAFHSFKIETEFEVYVKSLEDESEISLGTGTFNVYTRQPGLPEVGASPFRLPDSIWWNASILFALVTQWGKRDRGGVF